MESSSKTTGLDVLNRNLYLVKEHVGMFKAANNFDIYDPETGDVILECREEKLGMMTKVFRFTDYKRMTPFRIEVREPGGQTIFEVTRGLTVFLSKVQVADRNGTVLGGFKQRFFSIGGAFNVLDPDDQPLCTLKGKWTSWSFRFLRDEVQLAQVSKKWAGLGKELFTSADNYILEISDEVPPNHPVRALILAAVLCIDMVLKE